MHAATRIPDSGRWPTLFAFRIKLRRRFRAIALQLDGIRLDLHGLHGAADFESDVGASGRSRIQRDAGQNGFFYVLDRTDGKLLLGKPFVKKLTWAKEIGPNGRPIRNPDVEPTEKGTKVCPAVLGAANWWSTAFDPSSGLYYIQAIESCGVYLKRPVDWQAGRGFMGGSSRNAPGDPPQRFLRAIDIQSGKIAWEYPQTGSGESRSGTLATASGLVFFGEDSGAVMAADSSNGKVLWHFQTSQSWRASPMTYMFDNKQYIALASGSNILVFGVMD